MNRNTWIHISCWSAFALTLMLRDSIAKLDMRAVFESVVLLLPAIPLFYFIAFVAAPFLTQQKYLRFILLSVAAMVLFALLRFALQLFFLAPHITDYVHSITFNFWNGFIFSLAACGYYLAHKYFREDQNRQKLQEELKHAELAYLKAQMNPHFLHNSLNFMYAQSMTVSEQLSKSILLLSDMMRYSIESTTDGKVPLGREVKQLQNFIGIHRQRFKHKLQVNVQIDVDETSSTRILPFVLISIAENAFKHGVVTELQHPLSIQLSQNKNTVDFHVRNLVKREPGEPTSSGLGLANIKRMLALAYENRYELNINKDENYFDVHLQLKLD